VNGLNRAARPLGLANPLVDAPERVVGDSGQGHVHRHYCVEMAKKRNRHAEVMFDEPKESGDSRQ
jgi:hypothetical protein